MVRGKRIIIMLSCKKTTQRLSEAQDRGMSMAEKLQLKMHLAMCSGCSNFSKQLDFLRVACKRYIHKAGQNDDRHD